jgi:predicted DNA-binding protein
MSRELEAKLEAAAKKTGKPQSQLMREGIEAHCANLLSQNGDGREDRMYIWREAIGAAAEAMENLPPEKEKQWRDLQARFPDGPSRHSKEIFAEIMDEKEARIMGRPSARNVSSANNGRRKAA